MSSMSMRMIDILVNQSYKYIVNDYPFTECEKV